MSETSGSETGSIMQRRRGNEHAVAHDPTFSSTTRGAVTLLPTPEKSPLWCPVISVDDHALEPYDTFTRRVPAAMRDEAPHVVEDEEGVPYWVIDGVREPVIVTNGSVGRPKEEWTHAPAKYDEFRDGVHSATARLVDMDIDGTWASLCFPSLVFGFAGKVFAWMGDHDVALASLTAWNDWMIEEWCAAAPDRYIPCQLAWLLDPEIAAAHIRRNAARGFKAVSFSENPEGLGLPSIHTGYWDPFLAACEETGTVINLHVGSSGNVNRPSSDSPREAVIALFPVNGMFAAVDWLFAKIPVRFPDIRICLSEAGASWVPMITERLGRAYRQIGSPMNWTRADGDPTEILRRNFRYASLEDPSAFRLLDVVGEDNVMVEADYPHPDSVWPDTQELIRGELNQLPNTAIRKLCYANAAALYRHPLPPADLIAKSTIGSAG